MNFRYSLVAVGLASAFAAGCNMSQDRSTATFESTIEANAAAAEAAEAEVAKLSEIDSADEKPVHGDGLKGDRGHKAKTAKTADHKSETSHNPGKKNAKNGAKDSGAHGSVGARASESKTASPRKPASSGKNHVFIVQVGAFRVKENAERLHTKLKSEGFPVIMREMQHSRNGHLYLVRLEPTPNRQEAETLAASLKTKSEMTPAIIVRPEGD